MRGQVFVSSHSPEFLNALKLQEIYCFQKKEGFTQVIRPSDSETLNSLFEAGALPRYLWKQDLLMKGLN